VLVIALGWVLAAGCGHEDIELGGASTGGATSVSTCANPVVPDPLESQRAVCAFVPGTMPRDSITISQADQQRIPIRHVIVMIKENRSYDHLLGHLPSHGQPSAESIPVTYASQGGAPVHATTTCLSTDPPHLWEDQHAQVDGGKMDGFGSVAMYYYDQPDVPFYYWFANTFALADRYFSSVLAGSGPTRAFALLATSAGMIHNDDPPPPPTTPSIMGSLDQKGISWAVFTDDQPFYGVLGSNWPGLASHVRPSSDFVPAVQGGTLPAVSWLEAGGEDEHPPSDVQAGEAWTRTVYEAISNSPLWSTSALFWTYDEGGGFFDHVAPPHTCPPADGTLNEAMFFELGVRVPMVVASPWARRHYVSHIVHEHTSMMRFIETVFDLPALTARDANSDALLDMFDFNCLQPLDAPPPAGSGGCQ
jgi:phospholipase C